MCCCVGLNCKSAAQIYIALIADYMTFSYNSCSRDVTLALASNKNIRTKKEKNFFMTRITLFENFKGLTSECLWSCTMYLYTRQNMHVTRDALIICLLVSIDRVRTFTRNYANLRAIFATANVAGKETHISRASFARSGRLSGIAQVESRRDQRGD